MKILQNWTATNSRTKNYRPIIKRKCSKLIQIDGDRHWYDVVQKENTEREKKIESVPEKPQVERRVREKQAADTGDRFAFSVLRLFFLLFCLLRMTRARKRERANEEKSQQQQLKTISGSDSWCVIFRFQLTLYAVYAVIQCMNVQGTRLMRIVAFRQRPHRQQQQ